jgi:hypothetical protein
MMNFIKTLAALGPVRPRAESVRALFCQFRRRMPLEGVIMSQE